MYFLYFNEYKRIISLFSQSMGKNVSVFCFLFFIFLKIEIMNFWNRWAVRSSLILETTKL